jgi:hypothetical protein
VPDQDRYSPTEARNQIRKQETQAELKRISDAMNDWLCLQRDMDRDGQEYVGRHKSQLEAIESLLSGAIAPLKKQIDDSEPGLDSASFYSAFRAYDEAIVGLERVWQYFRDKLDQRVEGRRERPVLRAADEVVWSCYRPVISRVFGNAGPMPSPPPLAYVAPEYSPAALQSDRPPASLMMTADLEFLQGFMKNLPVALLRLPPWIVASPWWLVYVAHEVGHFVQKDLKLIAWFAAGVRNAAGQSGQLNPSELDKWSKWGEEIFADAFSIMMMGPWAILGILEAEWSRPDQMVRRKPEYPSPAIRLALMRACARKVAGSLRESWCDPLSELDLDAIAAADPAARRDWSAVDPVSGFVLGPMRDGIGTLQSLCGVEAGIFADGGTVKRLSQDIDRPGAPVQRSLDRPRHLASASLQAWARWRAGGATAAESRANLVARTTEYIARSGEQKTRSRLMPSVNIQGSGADLLKQLLQRADE